MYAFYIIDQIHKLFYEFKNSFFEGGEGRHEWI